MTWHQWHHTASRSNSTNLFSRLACAKTSSFQPIQWIFAAVAGLPCAAWPFDGCAGTLGVVVCADEELASSRTASNGQVRMSSSVLYTPIAGFRIRLGWEAER